MRAVRQLRLWVGTAVSLAFLWWLLKGVDRDQTVDALRTMQWGWLLLALPLFAASIWVRALRWRMIIRPAVPLSRGDATALVVIGYAANNLLPVRAGEVVRAVLVQRRHGGSSITALGTIVVERVCDGLVLALMLAGTLALAGGNGVLRGLAALAGAGFAAVALALIALAVRPAPARRLLARALALPPAAIGGRLRAWSERLLDGLTLLRGPRTWTLVLAYTAAGWGLEAASYWVIGVAFGLPLHPALYLAVCGAANLAIAAPSTSGGIGPYEFFARETVVHFGASAAAGTAYAIALHAFVLLPITVAGVLLLWRRDLGLSTLTRTSVVPDARGSVP